MYQEDMADYCRGKDKIDAILVHLALRWFIDCNVGL